MLQTTLKVDSAPQRGRALERDGCCAGAARDGHAALVDCHAARAELAVRGGEGRAGRCADDRLGRRARTSPAGTSGSVSTVSDAWKPCEFTGPKPRVTSSALDGPGGPGGPAAPPRRPRRLLRRGRARRERRPRHRHRRLRPDRRDLAVRQRPARRQRRAHRQGPAGPAGPAGPCAPGGPGDPVVLQLRKRSRRRWQSEASSTIRSFPVTFLTQALISPRLRVSRAAGRRGERPAADRQREHRARGCERRRLGRGVHHHDASCGEVPGWSASAIWTFGLDIQSTPRATRARSECRPSRA